MEENELNLYACFLHRILVLWMLSFCASLCIFGVSESSGQTVDGRNLPDQIPSERFTNLFTTLEIDGTGTSKSYLAFLFEPRPIQPGRKYPMIVWLHGGGQPQYEFQEHYGPLLWVPRLMIQDLDHVEQYEFFVLVPKCPLDVGGWTISVSDARPDYDMLSVVAQFVDRAISEYPIDQERISVVGISSGATAAWELGIRHPDRFSAIAPLAGGCSDLAQVGKIGAVPVWTFANERHEGDLRGAHQSAEALNKADGNAYATIFSHEGHDAWSEAFLGEPQLLKWLLKKRRGDLAWYYPPGFSVSRWPTHFATSIGILLGSIALVWGLTKREFKRRKWKPVPPHSPNDASAKIAEDGDRESPTAELQTPRRLVSLKFVLVALGLYLLGLAAYYITVWISTPTVTDVH